VTASEKVEKIADDICAMPLDLYTEQLPSVIYLYKTYIVVVGEEGPYIISKIDAASYHEFKTSYEWRSMDTLEYGDYFKIVIDVFDRVTWRFPELEGEDYELE
jgi:hypothetical protein